MTHATFYHIADHEGLETIHMCLPLGQFKGKGREAYFVRCLPGEIFRLDLHTFDQWQAQHFGDMPVVAART